MNNDPSGYADTGELSMKPSHDHPPETLDRVRPLLEVLGGKIPPITLRGTLDAPRLNMPDLVQQALDQGLQRAADKLLEKGLDRIFKKKKNR